MLILTLSNNIELNFNLHAIKLKWSTILAGLNQTILMIDNYAIVKFCRNIERKGSFDILLMLVCSSDLGLFFFIYVFKKYRYIDIPINIPYNLYNHQKQFSFQQYSSTVTVCCVF